MATPRTMAAAPSPAGPWPSHGVASGRFARRARRRRADLDAGGAATADEWRRPPTPRSRWCARSAAGGRDAEAAASHGPYGRWVHEQHAPRAAARHPGQARADGPRRARQSRVALRRSRFHRSPESRRVSEPPESIMFDAPPRLARRAHPGPMRVPRDLARVPRRRLPGRASRSARGPRCASLPRCPSDRLPIPPRLPWPAATDSVAGRAAAESLRAAAPLGVSMYLAPAAPDRAEATGAASAAAHGAGRHPRRRAAAHLTEAGEHEEAARRYCAAAVEAADMGAACPGAELRAEVLSLLDGMPATPARRRLRIGAPFAASLGCSGRRPAWTPPARSRRARGARRRARSSRRATRRSCTPRSPRSSPASAMTWATRARWSARWRSSPPRAAVLLDAGGLQRSARPGCSTIRAAVHVRMGDPVRATHSS